MFSRITSAVAIAASVSLAGQGAAQGAGSQPARTVPLLTAMSAEEQTRLALSTAAPEVTSRASIYVYNGKGYSRTRTGTNGFSCLVEREMPETIEPVCYDAEGSATLLLARIYREELRARGLTEDEVKRQIDAGYRSGKLQAPRKPGMVYMLAKESWTYNPIIGQFMQGPPHFMLYAPYAKQEDFGGGFGPQVPYIQWAGQPDALIIIMASDTQVH